VADLVVDLKEWLENSSNLLLFGQIWERVFASCFVTKYQLISTLKEKKKLNLIEFYEPIHQQSQACKLLNTYSVDLSEGLAREVTETTLNSIISHKKFYLNQKIQNAHYNAVVPAIPTHIAIQNKYTLQPPDGGVIKLQIPTNGALLWVYPGYQEDSPSAPKAYKTKKVIEAINGGKLAFLSGVGCIHPLTLDLLISLKKILLDQNILKEADYS